MDLSLPLITPEFWEDCGAQTYDDGLPITAHNMNPGAAAIEDFENGWHRQRIERSRLDGNQVQQLEVSPP
jgi:hypothetical protein